MIFNNNIYIKKPLNEAFPPLNQYLQECVYASLLGVVMQVCWENVTVFCKW